MPTKIPGSDATKPSVVEFSIFTPSANTADCTLSGVSVSWGCAMGSELPPPPPHPASKIIINIKRDFDAWKPEKRIVGFLSLSILVL